MMVLNGNMNARERIIDVAHRLQEARARVRELEAELDALLQSVQGGRRQPSPEAPEATATPQRRRPGSVASRVLEVLEAAPEESFRVPDLAERLGYSNLRSLRATMLRLTRSRKIRRASRGYYRAATRAGRRRAGRAS